MTASEIAVWIDIVASLAVLVTLVFLVVQIRQTNSLMRSEARQAQVINDQEHIYKFIEFRHSRLSDFLIITNSG